MTANDPYILVTGSREWDNQNLIQETLTTLHWMLPGGPHLTLVHGGCRGADLYADYVAMSLGWRTVEFRAQWEARGKGAGFFRNQQMVDFVASGPGMCLAFILDDSKGATHCADAAEKAGIETLRFKRYTNGVSDPNSAEAGSFRASDPDILRAVEAVERSYRLSEGQGH